MTSLGYPSPNDVAKASIPQLRMWYEKLPSAKTHGEDHTFKAIMRRLLHHDQFVDAHKHLVESLLKHYDEGTHGPEVPETTG